MSKQKLQRYTALSRKIPVRLLRLLMSVGLAAMVYATVVPLAQAQRGYVAFWGEYLLLLAAAVLPLCIFRR